MQFRKPSCAGQNAWMGWIWPSSNYDRHSQDREMKKEMLCNKQKNKNTNSNDLLQVLLVFLRLLVVETTDDVVYPQHIHSALPDVGLLLFAELRYIPKYNMFQSSINEKNVKDHNGTTIGMSTRLKNFGTRFLRPIPVTKTPETSPEIQCI